MEKKWWKEAVVYQIYPRSFCDSNHDGIGDIQGIISKLDYLALLGIDVIWLSPLYRSPNIDNGYDISDYEAINEEFGDMKDFDQLLEEAHKRSIKIIMDLVVNHTSDEHQWFRQAKSSKDNKYHDYYFWSDTPTNFGSWFGGSAWQYSEECQSYYFHAFSKKQVDLNWDNPKVRNDIYAMMRRWLDKGVDGFRMDVISCISKTLPFKDSPHGDMTPFITNGPHIHDYLQEMNREVLSKYDIMTVGECPNVSSIQARDYVRDNELNMIFTFDHVVLDDGPYGKWSHNKVSLIELKKTMNRWQEDLKDGWNSLYLDNHDQPRLVSRFGNDSKAYREISAKCIALTLHFMRGTPYIYQGEELGMTNAYFDSLDDYRDIETINAYKEHVERRHIFSHDEMMNNIKAHSRDNARTPMQWNDEKYGGFSDVEPWIKINPNYTEINAKNELDNKESIFYFYKKLIELRHDNDIIVYGDYLPLLESDDNIFAYKRTYNRDELLVFANWSNKNVPLFYKLDQYDVFFTNDTEIYKDRLKPYQAIVYKKRH